MSEVPELLPAPRNALNPPPGKDRKHGRPGAGALVLARLIWPNHTEIVPAIAVWFSDDRTCIEWRSPRGKPRQTWLPSRDVRPRLRYTS